MDQLATDAAGRDHCDLAGLTGLGVTHGDDGFNAVVAVFGDGTADGGAEGDADEASDAGDTEGEEAVEGEFKEV